VGADFTFADFPYFDMTDDRRERFTELLNNLSPEQTAEFQDWFGLEDDDSFHPADLLDDIEYACGVSNREISTMCAFTEKGEKYELNVTGGMSWGDPPTDALTYIDDIYYREYRFERAGFIEEIYNLAVDYSIEYCKMHGATA